MESIDGLLRKIRIDFQEVGTNDYNPLPLALKISNKSSKISINYQDTYHKLEAAMQNVIESSFQGFSDSVYSYKACFKNIIKCIERLEEIKENVNSIKKSYNIDIKALKRMEREIETKEIIVETLEKIYTLKNLLYAKDDFGIRKVGRNENLLSNNSQSNESNLIDESNNLYTCFKLFNELKEIKAIASYAEEIVKKRNNLLDKIVDKIFSFVFENENRSTVELKAIFIVDCLEEIDERLYQKLKYIIYKQINNILIIIQKDFIEENKSIINANFVKFIAKRLNLYINRIIRNYEIVCEKVLTGHVTKPNYFDKNFDEFKFFDKTTFLESIKSEIRILINYYTPTNKNNEEILFSLDDIEDTLDYDKIFDFKIKKNQTHKDEYKKEYIVICDPTYDFLYFLYLDIFFEMKEELFIILKNKFYKQKEKKTNKTIKKLFSRSFFKIKNNKLLFYEKVLQIIDENNSFGTDFGYKNCANIFDCLIEKFEENFHFLYESDFIKNFFVSNNNLDVFDIKNMIKISENSEKHEGNIILIFFTNIYDCNLEGKDVMFSFNKYKISIISILTINNLKNYYTKEIIKYEKIEMDSKLEEIYKRLEKIENKYVFAFQLQIIIDIYFWFDKLCREGEFGTDTEFLNSIIKIIKMLEKLNCQFLKQKIQLYGVITCIKTYIFRNILNINFKSIDDINEFKEILIFFEEIVCNFEMEFHESFNDCFLFLDDVINGNCDTDEKKKIHEKILERENL